MSEYQTTLERMLYDFEVQGKCAVEDNSDLSIKFKVIAKEISNLYDRLAYYEKQIFPLTAEGEYLNKHGEAKGIFKKTASKSTGVVVFKTAVAAINIITIPIGTQITCSDLPNIIFKTTKIGVIPVGYTSASIPIESLDTGKDTAIAPNMIDILVTPLTGITKVVNDEKIIGGSDGESDELYRLRVIESYTKISNGANLNYYEQLAKTIDDIWYAKAIYSSTNHIDIFVENHTRTISDIAISEVAQKISECREVGISVTVKRPTKKIVDVTATITVDNLSNQTTYFFDSHQNIMDYISSLSIGENVSLTKLGSKILSCNGIKDVDFTKPTTKVAVSNSEIVAYGVIYVTLEL